ncbi:MAG: 50S ribosomal protein L19 [Candidatus Marinimicrobia bacterium]|jgi:large subunit ribosomal protein L19|nr:50S ribosomal protein L19 [Gammaproteobacteria bacterium]MBL6911462.1 50S ribosomal protein L19 [Candidatus Neomarinimicrobiota bacterium]MBT3727998.1 50S ribosomal protein L19 [Candidatus Neomarinimicrobiota bacterium]MBT3944131.1 50S ribosomal protein L19 [Candidatus Neomarinimicrobiota bacterium]MBT4111713.1 50S ribosomal protein L19 [Candidatus Neomarinimicrobiota bacterium]
MIKDNLRDDIPDFKTGDTLSINVNVREGTKVRQQLFKGTVIARKGSGIAETITIRKMSDGIGVERIFPLHSPVIASIKVDRVNKVRRAKLYYLRGLSGKAARLAEKK